MFIELKSPVQNDNLTSKHYHCKCNSHITSEMTVYSFHYNDLTINWYNCSKWLVTVALLLMHSFMETDKQYSMFRSWKFQDNEIHWHQLPWTMNQLDYIIYGCFIILYQTLFLWSHVPLFQTMFSDLTLLYTHRPLY